MILIGKGSEQISFELRRGYIGLGWALNPAPAVHTREGYDAGARPCDRDDDHGAGNGSCRLPLETGKT